MIITNLSASSIEKYRFCPHAYFIGYVLRIREKSGLAADKGNIVHDVIDNLSKSVMKDEPLSDSQIETLIETQYANTILKLTHHNWKNKDFADVKKWTWMALRYKDGMFDPRNLDIYGSEKWFEFPIEKEWAKVNETEYLTVRGKIDLVVRRDNNVIECIDWKTGKRKDWASGEPKTYDYLRHKDFQMKLYHYASIKLFPDASQVIMTIYFIKDGGPYSLVFDSAEIKRTEEIIQHRFEQIKKVEVPELNKTWKCTRFCGYGKECLEDKKSLVEFREGQFSVIGQPMKICSQIEFEIKQKGINRVTEKYGKQ